VGSWTGSTVRKGWFTWLEAWEATVRARRCVNAMRHRGTRQALNTWRAASRNVLIAHGARERAMAKAAYGIRHLGWRRAFTSWLEQ
jgi:hypothetical protein